MLYIKPNYNSWVMLPLIGNVTINTLLINNIFIGIEEDKKEDYLYILVNNHCDKDTQNYVSKLKSAKSFVNFEFIDIDLMLFKFKIDTKHVDYNALINAKYNNISSSYCHNLAEYILDNLAKDKDKQPTLPETMMDFVRLLIYISRNAEELLHDYFYKVLNCPDDIIEQIRDTGVYFSRFNENNFFNKYLKTISI